MTQAANWDTRWEVQKQHIVWRETFYQVKFNILQRAYAHFRMVFVDKDTIIGANCTLADYCDKYRTVDGLREAIGDTPNTDKNKAYFHSLTDAKKVLAWAIRVPFLLIALIGAIILMLGQGIVDSMQWICQRLPGKV
jgi:hypothetical protein